MKTFLKMNLVFLIILGIMVIFVFMFGYNEIFEQGFSSNIFSELFGIFFTSLVVAWHIEKFGQPELEISPNIAQSFNKEKNTNEFRIKVINKTKYDLINIQNEFYYIKKIDNILVRNFSLVMFQEKVNYIRKFSKKDMKFHYCKRYLIYTDLESYKYDNEDDYFRFVIIASNSNTAKSKVFIKEYKKENIIKGKLDTGFNFNIINDCLT